MTLSARPPRLRPVLLTAALAVALAGCGTQAAPGSEAAGRGGASAPAPDRAELEARAKLLQTVADHVWVTEAEGYTLARQSVGVLGDDGFSSFYTTPDGGQFQLSAERGSPGEDVCEEASADAPGGRVTCERDGRQWYRTSDLGHEYARARDGLVVRVGGALREVDRATLRKAALAAHRADDHELDQILPPTADAPAQQPVERGDLPPVGDGAPDNGVGASG
ncbi:hypothetical protein [Streptomyces pratensis]|uniref:hypothetical protein n=1 Tax=Streptomyces pratensis TaxID=1169025 RepID=UPI00301A32B1